MRLLLNLWVYSLLAARLAPAETNTLNYTIYKSFQQGPGGC